MQKEFFPGLLKAMRLVGICLTFALVSGLSSLSLVAESSQSKGQSTSGEDLWSGPRPSSAPLSFSIWRDQQIADAKNQVVRRSNRLQLAANAKLTETSLQEFDFAKEERALAEAIETLQHAEERSREDYFEIYLDVYLVELKSDLGALESLMQSITGPEAAELVQRLLAREQLPSKPLESSLKPGAALSQK